MSRWPHGEAEIEQLIGCAWFPARFVVPSGLECPSKGCRMGTLMARSRS